MANLQERAATARVDCTYNHTMKPVLLGLLLALAAPAQTAPTFDSSGNSQLNGTYYFRQVVYVVGDTFGRLNEGLALYGNITFDGNGTYTMTAISVYDAGANTVGHYTIPGTYSISASGYGFLSNPVSQGDSIYGLVSNQGIFIGSDTENGNYNDMFIAAPLTQPAPTLASFKGKYSIADVDLSSGTPASTVSTMFQLNFDGSGNLGNVALSGYVGQTGSTLQTQTAQNVKYSFSNGGANITFPAISGLLVAGQKLMYISADGNFMFGGSPSGLDMMVGVRVSTDAPNFSGRYYQAGIDQDTSAGFGNLDTYFGALSADSGTIVAHQRLADVFYPSFGTDITYRDGYTVKSDGTYSTGIMRYVVGAGGIRIGSATRAASLD